MRRRRKQAVPVRIRVRQYPRSLAMGISSLLLLSPVYQLTLFLPHRAHPPIQCLSGLSSSIELHALD